MITRTEIQKVENGCHLIYAEEFPYKGKTVNWVDFKQRKEDCRYVAIESHIYHVLKIVEDLVATATEKEKSLAARSFNLQLLAMAARWAMHRLNHRQICRELSSVWQEMHLYTHPDCTAIVLHLQEVMKYEMTSTKKRWLLA
jgi:hypothetical protein